MATGRLCRFFHSLDATYVYSLSVIPGLISISPFLAYGDELKPMKVSRAAYFTGQTALHFAAAGGHVRCIRLLVADFVPPFSAAGEGLKETKNSECSSAAELDQLYADFER